jgi:hypothetical protein
MTTLTPARATRVVSHSNFSFDEISDCRAYRGDKQETLAGILNLMITGLACGKIVLRAIEDLSADMNFQIRKQMGLKERVSDTTQYELLIDLSPIGFRETLWDQLRKAVDSKAITNNLFEQGILSYDGKGGGSGLGEPPNELCRRNVCDAEGTVFWDTFVLRACLTSSLARPCLDQEIIPSKKGEATTFPIMLERDVKQFPRLFRYITGDAGLASKTNAKKVLDLGKVYFFQIKGNFNRVFPLASRLLSSSPVVAETNERAQGMHICRQLRRIEVPPEIKFPGATQFVGVRQIRTKNDGVIETEDRVFITAIPWEELSADKLLLLARLHWGIENNANWTCDVIFKEDTRRPCNQGNGPLVALWIMAIAYNIVAIFRAHLPLKDRQPQRWERARELIYQAFLGVGYSERKFIFDLV